LDYRAKTVARAHYSERKARSKRTPAETPARDVHPFSFSSH
jgi:hypothetical protein